MFRKFSGGGIFHGEFCRENVRDGISGECSWEIWGIFHEEIPRCSGVVVGNGCRDPMQAYQSLRAAVLTCVTLVNSLSHTHRQARISSVS